jgi:cation diffusion facilitator CzcD-associated flavoprotein CzcO
VPGKTLFEAVAGPPRDPERRLVAGLDLQPYPGDAEAAVDPWRGGTDGARGDALAPLPGSYPVGQLGASRPVGHQPDRAEKLPPEFDAIVVGAGFSGLYMLHSLRKQGLSVRVYEQGGGVGGTWYWNRYPGVRCDSESVYYMFTDHMSGEILGEWDWSERYAAQPEILRYLEFVTDKMDLRRYIQFNARVVSAIYDPERNRWDIRLADGGAASARFLVTAVGCLSSTNIPKFPGIDTFAGESYHTGAWPHEDVDFTGKRVAVIGTGATAVQAVPEIAKQAAHVWVFQRTPNYDIPGRCQDVAEKGYEGLVLTRH